MGETEEKEVKRGEPVRREAGVGLFSALSQSPLQGSPPWDAGWDAGPLPCGRAQSLPFNGRSSRVPEKEVLRTSSLGFSGPPS